jgi:hypothetical protein
MDFCIFSTMAFSSFSSFGAGALVTTQGWQWLNLGSLVPVAVIAIAIVALHQRRVASGAAVRAA